MYEGLKNRILATYQGIRKPIETKEVKTFRVQKGVKVGDIIATEYGALHVHIQIRPTKFKAKYINGNAGEAYIVAQDAAQNAIIMANAKAEK